MIYFRALLWIPYLIVSLILMVLGLLLVPIAIRFGQIIQSPINRTSIFTAPDWLWLWGNDEEGYDSDNARSKFRSDMTEWERMYRWAAIRNPIGNLRFVKWMHPPQQAAKVQWVVRGNWAFIYQGWLSRLVWNDFNRVYETGPYASIGWKYEAVKQDAEGWQEHGQGFSLRWVRK